jgi:hypothetical protein
MPTEYLVLNQRFSPGFIVLSYLIAVIGSLCTLELLIRRTTNVGWRNKLLLSTAGICFGAVSTFSMHFVFNNALTLSHPDIQNGEALALIYAPGYTVLSLVASCMAMTIAFFVMGTSVSEWYCVPGSRDRRARRKQERKRTGDEYRRWKTYQAQNKSGDEGSGRAMKSGTEKIKALVTRAAQAAKWSMMEHGIQAADDPYAHQAERDFRLGTGVAKKVKDFDPTNDAVQLDPPSMSEGILANKRSSMSLPRGLMHSQSIRPMPSDPNMGSTPTTANGNGPSHSTQPSMTDPSDVFAPNYNFPPRPDSAASLIVRSTPSPQTGMGDMDIGGPALPIPAAAPWTRRQSIAVDNSAHASLVSPDFGKRRSSLPAITPLMAAPATGYEREHERERMGRDRDVYMNTLSRIQSLPEVEQAPNGVNKGSQSETKSPWPAAGAVSPKPVMSPEYELEKGDLFSPKSGHASLSASHHSRDAEPGIRRRLNKDKLYSSLERFLGFDVVTLEDIWKIVLTGTIAGCGVAGMRRSFGSYGSHPSSIHRVLITRLHRPTVNHRHAIHRLRPRLCRRISRHCLWRRRRCAVHHVYHAPPETQAPFSLQALRCLDPCHRGVLHALLRHDGHHVRVATGSEHHAT